MFKTYLKSKYNVIDPFEINSSLGEKISLIEESKKNRKRKL